MGLVRLGGDWASIVDAAYAERGSDEAWIAGIWERVDGLVPGAALAAGIVRHAGDFSSSSVAASRVGKNYPPELMPPDGGAQMLGREAFRTMYFPPYPAVTQSELRPALGHDKQKAFDTLVEATRVLDAVGLLVHPEPGVVLTFSYVTPFLAKLSRVERTALTRIGLHIESGYRLRRNPDHVRAVIDSSGRVIHREADAPPTSVLEAHGRRVLIAQRDRSLGGVELWSALVDARMSIVPRGSGKRRRLLVIENPTASRHLRALTKMEAEVLHQSSRGLAAKLIAFALGVSPATISRSLTEATAKIGLASRIELVRLAALITRDPRSGVAEAKLTAAEREVLGLLQQGLSNDEIGRMRSRSARTVANQVASLLRKTGSQSRQDLASR